MFIVTLHNIELNKDINDSLDMRVAAFGHDEET